MLFPILYIHEAISSLTLFSFLQTIYDNTIIICILSVNELGQCHKNHLLPQFGNDDRQEEEQTIEILTEHITKVLFYSICKYLVLAFALKPLASDSISTNLATINQPLHYLVHYKQLYILIQSNILFVLYFIFSWLRCFNKRNQRYKR